MHVLVQINDEVLNLILWLQFLLHGVLFKVLRQQIDAECLYLGLFALHQPKDKAQILFSKELVFAVRVIHDQLLEQNEYLLLLT